MKVKVLETLWREGGSRALLLTSNPPQVSQAQERYRETHLWSHLGVRGSKIVTV